MTFRRDNDGWNRYRGSAKRGRQDLRTAIVDLQHAINSAEQARDALKRATSVRDVDAIERAMDYAALAGRFLRAAMQGRKPKQKRAAASRQLKLLP